MTTSTGKHFVLPTHKRADQRVLMNTEELESALENISARTDCFVQLERKDSVCMFTFATIVYSIAVEKNRAVQNIIVLRGEEDMQQERVQRISSFPKNIESHLFEVGIKTCTTEKCMHDVWSKYDIVAVGGTFDRLHAGHRLLLTIAAWTAKKCLWVGVTGPKLLQHKRHFNLISPFAKRADDVRSFVEKTKPSLEIRIQELQNAAGAAGEDPSIQALVISRETMNGALAVNEQRKQRGLKNLDLVVVDILFQSATKLSSTALREAEFRDKNSEHANSS